MLLSFAFFFSGLYSHAQNTPDKIYGQLFKDVQLQKILRDGKTFVDCTPKRPVKDIMYDYGLQKGENFDLKKFVEDNFNIPVAVSVTNLEKDNDATAHIKNLWSVLKRSADRSVEGSSLLPLPNAYIVPGGRFREIYYWDSYFTMLGLKESGETVMIENMIKNFAYLIRTYGHIPNGNRTYFLSRSQPPFFCMMVELLAGIKGDQVYKTYLPEMQKEYNYWMEGAGQLKAGNTFKRSVKLSDGNVLNRYWDESTAPRQESYREDVEVSERVANELAMRIKVASPEALKKILDESNARTCVHLRAGACSGWDFSSRWFADEKNISTIHTTDFIPVDLNCLLYKMEKIIALSYRLSNNKKPAALYERKAIKRKLAILKYCWNDAVGFFTDYDFSSKTKSSNINAAGLFPLFLKLATDKQSVTVAQNTEKYLLKDGGIVTTTNNIGQQWDAPNGWAPLQWVASTGLKNYAYTDLSKTIATRWVTLNDKVYAETGKMMEKYNVEDLTKKAGGGEYPGQDGFGWTNGVYLAFKKMLINK